MAPMNRRPSPTAPRSYVIRIYRRTAEELVGQVQDVLTGRVRVFRSMAALWSALGGRTRAGHRRNREPTEDPR